MARKGNSETKTHFLEKTPAYPAKGFFEENPGFRFVIPI